MVRSDQEIRDQAAELLKELQRVDVDLGVMSWPWWPFRPGMTKELLELERVKAARALSKSDDEYERQKAMETLVTWGGFDLQGGCLTLKDPEFRLEHHAKRVKKIMPIKQFVDELPKLIPFWKDDETPDWNEIIRELFNRRLISGRESYYEMTLLDVYWHLRFLEDQKAEVSSAAKVSEAPDHLTEGPAWVYRGDGWEVHWQGENRTVSDLVGMYYIGRLLGSPLQPMEVTVLHRLRTGEEHESRDSHTCAVLADGTTLRDVRRELEELTRQIVDAEEELDKTLSEQLVQEKNQLLQYLEEVVGWQGKPKHFKDATDQLFESVKKAVYRARDRMKKSGPPGLYDHLNTYLKVSKPSICYQPDDPTIAWQVTLPQNRS